ncbi:MAG: macro domain-containing protein [Acidimicrobiia bacterium]|nr:macro domain-containing protein [Acidimicrobiia bacterium]
MTQAASNVRVRIGDLFKSDAQTLTNTVNTVGVMGKGIALQFKKRFSDMYSEYVELCEAGKVRLGEPYLHKRLTSPWILNFPTKEHWRSPSRLDAIVQGLDHLAEHYREWGIESLAMPPLGCGEGQLEWRIVGPTLFRGLSRLGIPVELYAPFDTPHAELEIEFLEHAGGEGAAQPESRVPAAGVALAAIVDRISNERYHYPLGRVALQKIAYFATQAGIATGLEFERGPYGPFAEGLKRLLAKLVNNGLVDETRRGRMFVVSPGRTLRDSQTPFADELDVWKAEIDRVADLFLRLPTTRAAEIAASVHYVAQSLMNRERARGGGGIDEQELVAEVKRWKERREPPATEDEIVGAADTLAYLGWIDLAPATNEDELMPV